MQGLATVHRLQTARDAHMACEDNLSFMSDLSDGMMHLIVTSPPYNIGKRYERRSPLDVYELIDELDQSVDDNERKAQAGR
jgi:DNA modification methylase